MKRFLAIAIALLALVVSAYFFLFYTNFMVPYRLLSAGKEPVVSFMVKDDQVLAKDESGATSPLTLRSVEVSPAVPGHQFSDYAATYEDYLRWMGEISELGANSLTVTQLMDDEFYDALKFHNEKSDEPLLLIQGITAEGEYDTSSSNAYEGGMPEWLERQGKITIDSVHGRRDVVGSSIGGTGSYRSDVSQWVVAYLLTEQLDPDTVVYTDHGVVHDGHFEGTYFTTTEDASAFEALFARVMDALVDYESSKYSEQRPIGLTLDPFTDFLDYQEMYSWQLRKYAHVDAEHIQPTKTALAGRFVAYRLDDVFNNFTAYLTEQCRADLADHLAKLGGDSSFDAYLKLLESYHTMPTFGFCSATSARGASDLGRQPETERQQGEALRNTLDLLAKEHWDAQIISTWQDVWARRSWNTAFATDPTNAYLWHDRQNTMQNEGLMAFDPGAEPVCLVDGDASEWAGTEPLLVEDDLMLSVRQDAEGMYLLLQGVSRDDLAYVAFDVSPEMGATACADPALSFERPAEFVLTLAGETKSSLAVQERADAAREMFLYDMEVEDPFKEPPASDGTTFITCRMTVANHLVVDKMDSESRAKIRSGSWDTGVLTHGNGNPDAKDFNSLADFCYGQDCVELRIPWLLLNVGNPAYALVHGDYYKRMGVDLVPARSIYFAATKVDKTASSDGAADQTVMTFHPYTLKHWRIVTYRERLKQSYDVVQAAWTGGE